MTFHPWLVRQDDLYDYESNGNCFISSQSKLVFVFHQMNFKDTFCNLLNVFSTIFNWLNFRWKLLASFVGKKIRTKRPVRKKKENPIFLKSAFTLVRHVWSQESYFQKKFVFQEKHFFRWKLILFVIWFVIDLFWRHS